MNQALEYLAEHGRGYNTAKVSRKHLFTLGLVSNLTQKLQEYKLDKDLIMISDLTDFLTQIIEDSGSPFIYEKVGTWYSHFMIDEFQDTSSFQWNNFLPLLGESLANGHENILVGDAKQSIYGWRGGDPSILLNQFREMCQKQLLIPKKTPIGGVQVRLWSSITIFLSRFHRSWKLK